MAEIAPKRITFNNFGELVKEILFGGALGPNAIKLDLSGIKEGQKEFKTFVGSNMTDIVAKYGEYFDMPMDQEQVSFICDQVIASLASELRNKGEIRNAIVNANINKQMVH